MAKYKLCGLTFYILLSNVCLPIDPREETCKSNQTFWHTGIIDIHYKQGIKWEQFMNHYGLRNSKKIKYR